MPSRRSKAIVGALTVCLLAVGLSGCTKPAAKPDQSISSPQNTSRVDELEAKVSALTAEVSQYQNLLQEARKEVDRWRNQVTELEQASQANRNSYRQALQSPGYEAALRLVYQRLQQGDTSLLQELLPKDQPIEAGIRDMHQRTYRQYATGETVDLQQFVAWVKSRPLTAGTFSVVATQPGFAWAKVEFPDGTHFRIMFSGWTVTHILATDEPMMLS